MDFDWEFLILNLEIMKKTLAIFALTSCEGCQFEMLNHYEEFNKLLQFFTIKNFRLGQEINTDGPYDVVILEGSPDGEKQEKILKDLRKNAGILIALGACAHLGGIQSQRNNQPKKLINKTAAKTVFDVVKADYIIPGCPVRAKELYRCLMDIYWGKIFRLPDLAVCFECRQQENECLLKNGKVCLGPITRNGCDAICVNSGEACLGCRGLIPEPNVEKLKIELNKIVSEKEVKNLLSIYGDLDKNNG